MCCFCNCCIPTCKDNSLYCSMRHNCLLNRCICSFGFWSSFCILCIYRAGFGIMRNSDCKISSLMNSILRLSKCLQYINMFRLDYSKILQHIMCMIFMMCIFDILFRKEYINSLCCRTQFYIYIYNLLRQSSSLIHRIYDKSICLFSISDRIKHNLGLFLSNQSPRISRQLFYSHNKLILNFYCIYKIHWLLPKI